MTTVIHTLELGTMDNFIYIIADSDSGEALVVDPAWDYQAISGYCTDNQLVIEGILLTHTHYDHVSAVNDFLAEKSMPVYVSQAELDLGLFTVANPTIVADGDTLPFGSGFISVAATPGHTLGGVCYYIDEHLIAGDTLFIDGCGHCNFAESGVDEMWYSLQRLKQLPDEMIVYCGHNYGSQKTDTLGRQKLTNPYLLINDKDFFVAFRSHLQSQYRSIPFVPSSAEEMTTIYHKHS